MSFLYAKVSLVVFEDFSLVKVIDDPTQLFVIWYNTRVKALIDIMLPYRYVVFKINQKVLI